MWVKRGYNAATREARMGWAARLRLILLNSRTVQSCSIAFQSRLEGNS